jgi:hypothetical protein
MAVLLPRGAFLTEDRPIFTQETAGPLGVSPPKAVDSFLIETHASGTNVEGDLSQILQAVERVHAVLHAEGTVRLITVVKLATRTDKVPTLAGKRL